MNPLFLLAFRAVAVTRVTSNINHEQEKRCEMKMQARFLVTVAALIFLFGGVAQAQEVEITFSTMASAQETFFVNQPHEVTVNYIGLGPTTIELLPGVPLNNVIINQLNVVRGDFPNQDLSETRTLTQTITVDSESAVLSQQLTVRWIGNNQAQLTFEPSEPKILDLSVGLLEVTLSGEAIQGEANSTSGLLKPFATFVLVELPVGIDIKPGSCPNPLDCTKQDDLPVAILGTADFDVTQVDPVTVRLEGVAPVRSALQDVATPFEPFTGKEDCLDCTRERKDGFLDLTLKFDAQEVVEAIGDLPDRTCVLLRLTGNLREEFGGTPIAGEDVVRFQCKAK